MDDIDTKALKPGDEIAVTANYGRNYRIEIVDRVTPTGRVKTVSGLEYNADGWKMEAGSWNCSRIVAMTPEIRQEAIRQALLGELSGIDRTIRRLPVKALEQIAGILRSNKTKMFPRDAT